jgi:redox-sensitive bicupin YhaK (pirin superfamily)
MKKKISLSTKGQRADIGDITIYRMLPNRYVNAVGPFVFLDHMAPTIHDADEPLMENGTGAHPHRGIATLTYLLKGEDEHFDSLGHHAKVTSGGIQWMKAGTGIIHDEKINVDPERGDRITHGLQFWINLPSKNKAEAPQYIAVQANDVPQKLLDDKKSWIKVIAGSYEELNSQIPNYSRQFVYHVHLESGKEFSLPTEAGLEYAAFLPVHNALINEIEFTAGDFIEFDRENGTIHLLNNATAAIDIMLFGGENYSEPIVAQGPFVMNSELEIAQAYRDFYNGKYGEINYNKR